MTKSTTNYNLTPWLSTTWIPGSRIADQQATFLALLHGSLQESVPLAPMIRSLSREYPGSYQWKLIRVASLIEQGKDWLDAIEQTPGTLPDDSVLALRLGQQSGITNATLEQLRTENTSELIEHEPQQWRSYLVYWFAVSFLIVSILSGITYFIIPTFLKMLEEFDMPNGQKNLLLYSHYIATPIRIGLGLLCLGILLSWSQYIRSWFARLLRIPAASREKNHSALLGILANVVQHGRPMDGALSTLAKYHKNSALREKLLFARNEIEQGSDPWESLRSIGLLSETQTKTLEGQSNQDQAWILRSLAKNIDSKQRYRWLWFQSIIHPLITIAFGLAVLGISAAVIDVLYSIVTELAKDTSWRN
jgi:type II secretory pathway component PulF